MFFAFFHAISSVADSVNTTYIEMPQLTFVSNIVALITIQMYFVFKLGQKTNANKKY